MLIFLLLLFLGSNEETVGASEISKTAVENNCNAKELYSYESTIFSHKMEETIISLKIEPERRKGFKLVIEGKGDSRDESTIDKLIVKKEDYGIIDEKKLQVTSLRDSEKALKELFVGWRIPGSGGFYNYSLLDLNKLEEIYLDEASPSSSEIFDKVELLGGRELKNGDVDLKSHYLTQKESISSSDTVNQASDKWKESTFKWDKDKEKFVEEVKRKDKEVGSMNLEDVMLKSSNIPKENERLLERKALDQNVPPKLVKAISLVESGGRHYDQNGEVVKGGSGEIGIMQIYPDENYFSEEEIEKLYDLEYNIKTGIKILIDKKMWSSYVLPAFESESGDLFMHDNIMETWYFAIWAYNGWTSVNNPAVSGEGNTYQDRVYNQLENLGKDVENMPSSEFEKDLPEHYERFDLPGKTSAGLPSLRQENIKGESVNEARIMNTDSLNYRDKPSLVTGEDNNDTLVLGSLTGDEYVEILDGPHTNSRARWYFISRDYNNEKKDYGGERFLKDETFDYDNFDYNEGAWVAGAYKYDGSKLSFINYLSYLWGFQGDLWPNDSVGEKEKEWEITFNNPLDETTINNREVYIADASGVRIDVEVEVAGEEGNKILVSPENSFSKGELYKLYIHDNIKSEDGLSLKAPIRKSFFVEKYLN